MSEYHGWLSTSRSGVLYMAKNWNELLPVHGQRWLVLPADIADLAALTAAADAALQKARSAERTAAVTEQCREAFTSLEAAMRTMKRRYFYIPPLTADDIIALGLKLHDNNPSRIGIPDILIAIAFSYPGVHMIDLLLSAQAGAVSRDKRSLYQFAVRYGLMLPSGPATREQAQADHRLLTAVPVSPEELPCAFNTRRHSHRLEFGLDDSGKTLFITGCWLNPRGEPGAYCPIQSRLIP
ncbi:MAG: hypothetical protein LBD08_01815 [Treponema sp.]|jgi:hypothetical protein|nr:hypothetical protein [Treponema sp.]